MSSSVNPNNTAGRSLVAQMRSAFGGNNAGAAAGASTPSSTSSAGTPGNVPSLPRDHSFRFNSGLNAGGSGSATPSQTSTNSQPGSSAPLSTTNTSRVTTPNPSISATTVVSPTTSASSPSSNVMSPGRSGGQQQVSIQVSAHSTSGQHGAHGGAHGGGHAHLPLAGHSGGHGASRFSTMLPLGQDVRSAIPHTNATCEKPDANRVYSGLNAVDPEGRKKYWSGLLSLPNNRVTKRSGDIDLNSLSSSVLAEIEMECEPGHFSRFVPALDPSQDYEAIKRVLMKEAVLQDRETLGLGYAHLTARVYLACERDETRTLDMLYMISSKLKSYECDPPMWTALRTDVLRLTDLLLTNSTGISLCNHFNSVSFDVVDLSDVIVTWYLGLFNASAFPTEFCLRCIDVILLPTSGPEQLLGILYGTMIVIQMKLLECTNSEQLFQALQDLPSALTKAQLGEIFTQAYWNGWYASQKPSAANSNTQQGKLHAQQHAQYIHGYDLDWNKIITRIGAGSVRFQTSDMMLAGANNNVSGVMNVGSGGGGTNSPGGGASANTSGTATPVGGSSGSYAAVRAAVAGSALGSGQHGTSGGPHASPNRGVGVGGGASGSSSNTNSLNSAASLLGGGNSNSNTPSTSGAYPHPHGAGVNISGGGGAGGHPPSHPPIHAHSASVTFSLGDYSPDKMALHHVDTESRLPSTHKNTPPVGSPTNNQQGGGQQQTGGVAVGSPSSGPIDMNKLAATPKSSPSSNSSTMPAPGSPLTLGAHDMTLMADLSSVSKGPQKSAPQYQALIERALKELKYYAQRTMTNNSHNPIELLLGGKAQAASSSASGSDSSSSSTPHITQIAPLDILQVDRSGAQSSAGGSVKPVPSSGLIKYSELLEYQMYPALCMQGYLMKSRAPSKLFKRTGSSGFFGNLHRRYFLLQGSFLTYFKTHEYTKPTRDESVDLKTCVATKIKNHEYAPFAFQIQSKEKGSIVYLLFAQNETIRDVWLECLAQATGVAILQS